MSPKRGTISISRVVYERLHAYTESRGIAMAALVEGLLEPVLAEAAPPKSSIALAVPPPAPRPPRLDRALLDRIAADRHALGLVAAALPEAVRKSKLVLDIPPHVGSAIADLVERASAAGQEIEPAQLLEAAIERMLDALTARPWCRRCILAIEDCRCSPQRAQEDVLAQYKETPNR